MSSSSTACCSYVSSVYSSDSIPKSPVMSINNISVVNDSSVINYELSPSSSSTSSVEKENKSTSSSVNYDKTLSCLEKRLTVVAKLETEPIDLDYVSPENKYDVGSYFSVSHSLSDKKRYDLLKNCFVPDKKFDFPNATPDRRKFLGKWLEQLDWLRYSKSKEVLSDMLNFCNTYSQISR